MHRMFRRSLCRVGLFVVAVSGVALVAPSLAAAAQPSCGDTVTSNVTLHADLFCSNQDGLIVGAPRITINLNGFAIRNPNENFTGVDNGGGFNRVTVENGRVIGFSAGVYYDNTNHGKITGVGAFSSSGVGLYFESSQNGVIDHSVAGKLGNGNSDDGIYLANNHLVSVTNTKANWNGGAGITDHTSLDTLDHDTTNHNNQWGVFVYQPLTVNTSTGQKYWTVSNSTANNNNLDGFHVDENAPATLYQANLFGNTAEFNSGWGYFADSPAKSNTTNGAKGNSLGNCFHVKCHTNP
jgi:hypothetical protein